MPKNIYTALAIIIIALVTFGTRFAPFVFFKENKPTPKFVLYMGSFLPPAVMAMLIIYSIRNVKFLNFPFGLPEILGILAVGIVHHLKSNYLLSIITGTIFYMVLVQYIF